MSNSNTISVLAGSYKNSALRFVVQPGQLEKFHHDFFLNPNTTFKQLNVTGDSEGQLRASNRSLKLLFSPPTGNFKISLPQKQTWLGSILTGNFGNPGFYLNLDKDDLVYGFGSATGKFNRNNSRFKLLNFDNILFTIPEVNYSSFPFFMVHRGATTTGILVNSSIPFNVNIGKESRHNHPGPMVRMQPVDNQPTAFDVVFIHGTPAQILEQYSEFTAKPFLPPLWSLGLHQSRWSYKTSKRVLEIAEKYREVEVPCDAIHLDIHYMDRYRVFTWNREHFSDPAKLHQKLDRLNFKTVAIVDPGVAIDEDYPIYQAGLKKQLYCAGKDGTPYVGQVWPGKTVFPDFTLASAREWWAQHHKILFKNGVSGIWNDMNDPVLKMGKNYDPLKEGIQHHNAHHRQIHNLYANLEAEATNLAFKKFQPEKRPFVLTRSATCGMQKYAAIWTGDNRATWAHLRENLAHVINLGLSGMPFSGADVGGFAGGLPLPGMLKIFKFRRNRELFSRWLELGSLMPFFRIHAAVFSYEQDPWSFGQEVLDIARKHSRRRYRLLPYLYTLFCDASLNGSPVVRPMFYEFPGWQHAHIPDQFMLGSSLLAAPVLHRKQKKRKVMLPPGDWFEYETGKKYKGDNELELVAKPGYYPLFVRAGTALPVWFVGQSVADGLSSPLIWEIYPATKIYGRVILDDGQTKRPADSAFTEIQIDAKQNHSGVIDFKQSINKQDYTPVNDTVYLRLPEGYRQMLQNGRKKGEVQTADTHSEDRHLSMNQFEIGLKNMEAQFPYRSEQF